MKKIVVMCLLMAFIMPAFFVSSAKAKDKGANEQAYEHASENAIFNRVSDWFATLGKSAEEKEKILEERKAERAMRRAEKEAEKAQREAEKAADKKQKEFKQKGSGKK